MAGALSRAVPRTAAGPLASQTGQFPRGKAGGRTSEQPGGLASRSKHICTNGKGETCFDRRLRALFSVFRSQLSVTWRVARAAGGDSSRNRPFFSLPGRAIAPGGRPGPSASLAAAAQALGVQPQAPAFAILQAVIPPFSGSNHSHLVFSHLAITRHLCALAISRTSSWSPSLGCVPALNSRC